MLPYQFMRFTISVFAVCFILSCSDNREGISETNRNYDENTFKKGDSACMSADDGIFVFHKLNADSIANAINTATIRYFGNQFSTAPIRDSIRGWLTRDYFSGKTYNGKSWTLEAAIDPTKMSCNYKASYGLERFSLDLFYDNRICLKKLIGNLGPYKYQVNDDILTPITQRNRLRFLCEFTVDITYRPESALNTARKEYYRISLTDTVDVFTGLPDSSFVYR
jgi:hypothetical protein